MYRVTYQINESKSVACREFPTFKDASDFSIQQPENSIIEIKHYESKTFHVQNKSDNIS
jgi:hypothetical protein